MKGLKRGVIPERITPSLHKVMSVNGHVGDCAHDPVRAAYHSYENTGVCLPLKLPPFVVNDQTIILWAIRFKDSPEVPCTICQMVCFQAPLRQVYSAITTPSHYK